MNEWHTRSLAQRVLDDGPAVEELGQHPVAVLSSAVLRTARHAHGEDKASFAARARVAIAVVTGAEDGTQPAWALPFAEFTALADAVASTCPRPAFETSAACDLLLSCVLDGDQVLATDVLVEPRSQELWRALVRLAVTGGSNAELVGAEHVRLPDDLVALLRDRARALGESGSPDAWVGAEILAACWGERP
jgi:hypothetical protein